MNQFEQPKYKPMKEPKKSTIKNKLIIGIVAAIVIYILGLLGIEIPTL